MKYLNTLFFLALLLVSCTHPPTNYSGEYPDDVKKIFENKCATAGCHNDKSYNNAANLRLDTWANMFKGSGNGSVIIPYDVQNSSLTYFVNTDPSIGPVLLPQMPINAAPLSASEYQTLVAWIAAGAPDKVGNVPFASNAGGRQKIYVSQQGCDLIAVIDAETNLIMRYIKIGMSPQIEVAHCIRFSADGRYCYVSFTQGEYIQKIDVEKDEVVDNLYLGTGSWNLFKLSDDGKSMLISDFIVGKGRLKFIDLEQWKVLFTLDDFESPHGIASNPTFDTFLVTAQYGNTVYRVTKKGQVRTYSLDANEPNFLNNTLDPHEIILSPDGSKYFVTCQFSNEVRVMDTRTHTLLKVIPVGTFPQEFAMSTQLPYLFVSCQEEVSSEYPDFKGAIYVIDYNTLSLVKRIPGPFYQIHGLAVDDRNGKLFVASRNVATSGPAPHHTSQCGGRNGYYNVYDINTLLPFTARRFESSVDPYSADVRFK